MRYDVARNVDVAFTNVVDIATFNEQKMVIYKKNL